ncbi:MAG: (Fe-S)-binding protein [Thermodesulfobacteriota bacterium]
MSEMKLLVDLMRELEDQLIVCMRCGMCQAVCPLFEQTGREADVARGKLALLTGLMNEMFKDAEGTFERLNRCLLCGSCAANCPSGVKILDIFIKARAILAGFMGLSPAKRILLRGMLSHPKFFDRLTEWGAVFQTIFTKPVNDLIGTSCSRIASPLLSDRHFVPLASRPFHRTTPELNSNPTSSKIKVLFYVGCLIDKIFPQVAEAVVKALKHHGVGIFIPPNQGCCGIPAVSSGDMKSFEKLIVHNLNAFSGTSYDYLVTACATCTSTIKKIWPVMIKGLPHINSQMEERVYEISEKSMDINEFLVNIIGVSSSTSPRDASGIPITYHDPCHLKKSLGVYQEPRALIKSNPAYRFSEMPSADWCCGLGGSFSLSYYEISSRIGKKKRENIVTNGCRVVATGCPACMLQISDMLSQSGDRVRVNHPVEIYADSLW